MGYICAIDEYRSQVGATNRPENIVIRYVSVVSLSSICRYSEIFLINNCQCQNEVKNHTVPP
jgi:hypothetical protein